MGAYLIFHPANVPEGTDLLIRQRVLNRQGDSGPAPLYSRSPRNVRQPLAAMTPSAALIMRYRNSPEQGLGHPSRSLVDDSGGRPRTILATMAKFDSASRNIRSAWGPLRSLPSRVGWMRGSITVLQPACAFLGGLTRYDGVIACRERHPRSAGASRAESS
jgi:hypothetical protein